MPTDNTDLIPTNTLSSNQDFWEKILENFNIPHMLAGPAGKALSRLVAGVVDIPVAKLEGFAQDIKNKTYAKQLVNKKVASAAAKLASNDSDIVARAAHNLIAKEYRHQKNKEAIARKTITLLADDNVQNTPATASSNQLPPPEVDEDWLNVFEKYAEDASTERMQDMWARILAGEIRSPKNFSLKTLRFVSELDQDTASLFERYLPLVCNGDFLPIHQKQTSEEIGNLLYLQDAGLLTNVGGTFCKSINLTKDSISNLSNQGKLFTLVPAHDYLVLIPSVILTKIGKEISNIVQLPFSFIDLKEVVTRIPKVGLQSIALMGTQEILWPEPEQPKAPS